MSLIAGNLAVVQKVLDAAGLQWGVFAGAAAHLYGNRRPINDIDILVAPGMLGQVASLLQQGQKAVQFDGGRILWRGIKLFDDLTVRQEGRIHPFSLDTAMASHTQRKPLLGSKVLLLAPEDVMVHKLLLFRGSNEGKHDEADVANIVKRQTLDTEYLKERIALTGGGDLLRERLSAQGVDLD